MSHWDQCLYSILVCTVICGVVVQLVSDTRAKALVRMVCAVAVAISIGSPLSGIDLYKELQFFPQQWDEADAYVREGKRAWQEAGSACIEASCEAYILEKAKALGAEMIEVRITLDESQIPVFAEINGRMDREVQKNLQEILMTDLGIPKEQQTWIWNQESSSSST